MQKINKETTRTERKNLQLFTNNKTSASIISSLQESVCGS